MLLIILLLQVVHGHVRPMSQRICHGVARSVPPPTMSAGNAHMVAEVVESLFGTEDSRQAFARQSASISEVEQQFPGREKELTYGEFDLHAFQSLVAATDPATGEVFCDVGSGCGRLVLAAALAHPWGLAAGVELLEELHTSAVDAHDKLSALLSDEPDIAFAPCALVHGEAAAALPAAGGNIVFRTPGRFRWGFRYLKRTNFKIHTMFMF